MFNLEDPAANSVCLDDFLACLDGLAEVAIRCLAECEPFDRCFESVQDCVYVKATDLRIVYVNQSYRNVFSRETLPDGKTAESILHSTVLPLSQASDQMLLAGSRLVIFDHFGQDALGRMVLFRTAKRSLLGEGHAAAAIFGVTRVLAVVDDPHDCQTKIALLTARWNRFRALDSPDREIAIAFARGSTSSKIAKDRDVSKRNIEYRRTAIHEALGVDSQVDLAKLLVRFEEKGFGELGLG